MDEIFVIPNNPGDGIPEWLTSDEKVDDRVIEDWLYSWFYWDYANGLKIDLSDIRVRNDIEARARLDAGARLKVLQKTGALRNFTGRSIVRQLYYAHRSNWPKLIKEIDDVTDLLNDMLSEAETNPQSSNASELKFLVKTLIPTLEKFGIPPENIIGISVNLSKARKAIPRLRFVLGQTAEGLERLEQDKDNYTEAEYSQRQEEIQNLAKSVVEEEIQDIVNPEITFLDYVNRVNQRIGKQVAIKSPTVRAECYYFPTQNLVALWVPQGGQDQYVIQGLLNNIAKGWTVSDPTALVRDINRQLAPRQHNMKRYRVIDGKLHEDSSGYMLPDPLSFSSLVIEKYYTFQDLLYQIPEVPHLPLMTSLSFASFMQMDDFCRKSIGASFEVCSSLIEDHYSSITPEIKSTLELMEERRSVKVCTNYGFSFGLYLVLGG
jgi:hypothetical protein